MGFEPPLYKYGKGKKMPFLESEEREKKEKLAEEFEQEAFRFSQLLLEDGNIPEDINKNFWGFITKHLILSKVLPGDERSVMNQFEINYNFELMSKPDYKHNFNKELEYIKTKALLKAFLMRARGGFERISQTTQIRQILYGEAEESSGGVLKRIGGGFKKLFGR